MNDLDNELVPVIHEIGPGGAATSPSLGKVVRHFTLLVMGAYDIDFILC